MTILFRKTGNDPGYLSFKNVLGEEMSVVEKKFRLITRSNFDGLVSAVLLKELNIIDEITFAHPKDIQDGTVDVTPNDISTNLPYSPHCHLAINHHTSEEERLAGKSIKKYINDPNSPSASRLLFNHFGGKGMFGSKYDALLQAVDKFDTADYKLDEIKNPKGWDIIAFITDPRTGLGRFRKYRISNYQLMMDLISYMRDKPIEEILNLPDVKERIDLYYEMQQAFSDQLKKCADTIGKLIILDLRKENIIYPGNRFLLYALFPDCNISIHILNGKMDQNTVFAIGKSIFNKPATINVGKLALEFGGGGTPGAGACQADLEISDCVLQDLKDKIAAES